MKEITQKIYNARGEVDRNPTEKQKKAGNYKMGHINILGFNITIENPKGSYRRGKDRNGKEWKIKMNNDYGYFTRTKGKDGDAIDVFIGPHYKSTKIYAVDQNIGGKFDETKVMLCFNSIEEAKDAYMSNYEKDWKGFSHITGVDIDAFKKWLYDGFRQRKPFYQYAEFKDKKLDENVKYKRFKSKKEYEDYLKNDKNLDDIDKFRNERLSSKKDSAFYDNYGRPIPNGKFIPNDASARKAFEYAKWGHGAMDNVTVPNFDDDNPWKGVASSPEFYENGRYVNASNWKDEGGTFKTNLDAAKKYHNNKFPSHEITENMINEIICSILTEMKRGAR